MKSYVFLKFNSIENFQQKCKGKYFSINSNYNLVIGNFDTIAEIWDIYSPGIGVDFM